MIVSRNKILVVEDDINISKLIVYNLEKENYVCTAVYSGEDAANKLSSEDKYHLVILDIMLPGIDGLELCKKIRRSKKTSFTKILMLTAKGEESDRITGFELGADDYVVKPFSPKELVLRVKAILKRSEISEEVFVCGDLKLDSKNRTLHVNEKQIYLTSLEFDLLLVLIKDRGIVKTREALLDEVSDLSPNVTTRTVDTHIKQLRQKLEEYSEKIETVRSMGYRFIE